MSTRHLVAAVLASSVLASLPRVAHADEPAPAPPAPPAPTARPLVELQADDAGATLERRTGTSSYAGVPLADAALVSVGHWEQACVAPCTGVRLDPRYTYRVGGDGLVPSDSFALPAAGDRVRVDARMGSSTGRVAGLGLTVVGVAGVIVGGLAAASVPVLESQDVGSRGLRSALLAGGVTVASAALVATGAGLYRWATNGSNAHARAISSR